ncbi:MAG: hypothetical protein M0R66_01225 [Candidatus Omnitrophica bacterium]|nr:hypothetical protein [Candidatus Omnitrophota bacterium]
MAYFIERKETEQTIRELVRETKFDEAAGNVECAFLKICMAKTLEDELKEKTRRVTEWHRLRGKALNTA